MENIPRLPVWTPTTPIQTKSFPENPEAGAALFESPVVRRPQKPGPDDGAHEREHRPGDSRKASRLRPATPCREMPFHPDRNMPMTQSGRPRTGPGSRPLHRETSADRGAPQAILRHLFSPVVDSNQPV